MKKPHLLSFLTVLLLTYPAIQFADESQDRVGKRTSSYKTNAKELSSSTLFQDYPPVYFPQGIHQMIKISILGDSFELEDGSVWKVSPYDGSKVLQWASSDPLLITQNHRWFSKFKYKIINQKTKTSAEVNLSMAPIENGPYTKSIIAIDSAHRELVLNDLSRWKISSYDGQIFQDWRLHDLVIVGYNTGWDSDSEAFLINVDMNNGVRAQGF